MCILKCSKTTDNFAENFASEGGRRVVFAGSEFEAIPLARIKADVRQMKCVTNYTQTQTVAWVHAGVDNNLL